MFFVLSKIFGVLVKPVFYLFGGVSVAPFLNSVKRRRRLLIALVCILWVFGNKGIVLSLIRGREVPAVSMTEILPMEIGVTLGGMGEYNGELKEITLTRGGNRIWSSCKLLSRDKVERLIISGGHGSLVEAYSEAYLLRKDLIEMGYSPERIIAEGTSLNTFQNAVNTKLILDSIGVSKVLLITSALHMKRAKAIFEKQGIEVVPFSTDPYTGSTIPWYQWLYPQMHSFDLWSQYLHEVVGYWVYSWKGYL